MYTEYAYVQLVYLLKYAHFVQFSPYSVLLIVSFAESDDDNACLKSTNLKTANQAGISC